ncbi:MAG: hypothetical protein ACK4EY_15210 [Flavipsychrobacter sp.]
MLGQRALFDNLEPKPATQVIPLRKGRSSHEIARRNDYILHRYYYIKNSTKNSFEAIIEQVASEVWLSVVTTTEVLLDNSDALKRIAASQPTAASLKKKWPHILW